MALEWCDIAGIAPKEGKTSSMSWYRLDRVQETVGAEISSWAAPCPGNGASGNLQGPQSVSRGLRSGLITAFDSVHPDNPRVPPETAGELPAVMTKLEAWSILQQTNTAIGWNIASLRPAAVSIPVNWKAHPDRGTGEGLLAAYEEFLRHRRRLARNSLASRLGRTAGNMIICIESFIGSEHAGGHCDL